MTTLQKSNELIPPKNTIFQGSQPFPRLYHFGALHSLVFGGVSLDIQSDLLKFGGLGPSDQTAEFSTARCLLKPGDRPLLLEHCGLCRARAPLACRKGKPRRHKLLQSVRPCWRTPIGCRERRDQKGPQAVAKCPPIQLLWPDWFPDFDRRPRSKRETSCILLQHLVGFGLGWP